MNGGMKAPVQDDPLQEFLSLTLPDVELAAATARSRRLGDGVVERDALRAGEDLGVE
jgi:hypothetical protein